MTRQRDLRAPADLRDASEHLFYELWMLDSVARILALGALGQGTVSNALLESFSIHARALLQFFFPLSPKSDDVLAEDYFSGTVAWETVRGPQPEALNQVNRRVGKEVAHLTYTRLGLSEEAKQWRILEVSQALSDVAMRFRTNVKPELLSPKRWVSERPDA
jgi:hypothetical protein